MNKINVTDFLKKELNECDFKKIMKEDFCTDQFVCIDEGLLSVINDLFDWTSSINGYDFCYRVAHKYYA